MADQPATTLAAPPSRFVSFPELMKRSTLCRASIYNEIRRGELSRPVRISRNRVAFPAEVVDRWLASKMEGASA